jgi:hypothetical protein
MDHPDRTTGRRRAALRRCWATALLLSAGCAQPGPLSSRHTMIGGLKASVAQLESEKEGLKREVADLKSSNRRLEDGLAQERTANGEMAARLDDARNYIRRQGGELAGPVRSEQDAEPSLTPRTAPAGRNTRRRKSPLTQLPGEITLPSPSAAEDEAPDESDDLAPARPRGRDEIGPQSRRADDGPWLPVARGVSSPSAKVRRRRASRREAFRHHLAPILAESDLDG